jgi:outer membrane protein OmpA-like peptidoglycan-associated protein
MASMLAELRNLVTPELISEMSRETHQPEAAVTRAYDAAIPAVAAFVANKSRDHRFMNQLVDLAASASADPDPVKSAMRLASSASPDTGSAAGWMSSLFGQHLGGVTTNLARYAGVNEPSASSLLRTCAPLVLGFIGRFIRSNNLSAAGLADYLQREQSQIAAAVPAGFEVPGIVQPPDEAVVDDDMRPPRGERWAFPMTAVLMALGIASLLWWAKEPNGGKEPPRAKVETSEPGAVGTAGTIDPTRTPMFSERPSIAIPGGSSEDRLASYLASAGTGSMGLSLDRTVFATGSARLLPESKRQIDDVAFILRAHPNATVLIAGHTDNVGSDSANLALSRARAEMVASAFRDAGVAPERIRVEAYGSQKPVADNATASGRAQNRRVTLDVTR